MWHPETGEYSMPIDFVKDLDSLSAFGCLPIDFALSGMDALFMAAAGTPGDRLAVRASDSSLVHVGAFKANTR